MTACNNRNRTSQRIPPAGAADDNAYRSHIDGPYFQEYNKAVQTMVTDKVLIINKPQAVTLSGKNLK